MASIEHYSGRYWRSPGTTNLVVYNRHSFHVWKVNQMVKCQHSFHQLAIPVSCRLCKVMAYIIVTLVVIAISSCWLRITHKFNAAVSVQNKVCRSFSQAEGPMTHDHSSSTPRVFICHYWILLACVHSLLYGRICSIPASFSWWLSILESDHWDSL